MKLIVISFLLLIISNITYSQSACPAGWICPSTPLIPKTTRIGTWYSLYFYRSGTSKVDHWKSETRYRPLLGYYSSGDIIKDQYPFMKNAGIDYILLDHTNGIGNDGGMIDANADKIFKNLPNDIKIAIAAGGPLWNNHSEKLQNDEANYIFSKYAQKENYLKWYDSTSKKEKPLLIIFNDFGKIYPNDANKRNWHDSRFTVRKAAGYVDKNNSNLKFTEGVWGWVIKPTQITSLETMAVQPGWDTEHIKNRNHEFSPIKRDGGKNYMKQWLEVIKNRPSNIIIPSWNDWAEETAIEPAIKVDSTAEAFKDSYGTEIADWYLQITTAYTNLRTGLMNKSYYQQEGDVNVYKVLNGVLIYQSEMPHGQPVILLPANSLNTYILNNPNNINLGLFKIGADIYQINNNYYCYFPSMQIFNKITGKNNSSGIINLNSIPSNLNYMGNCSEYYSKNVLNIPKGLFKIGSNLFYTSGSSFCYFPNMNIFTNLTGKKTTEDISNFIGISTSMFNKGDCSADFVNKQLFERPTNNLPQKLNTIPFGLFKINSNIYFSDGKINYCQFASIKFFSQITGRNNSNDIISYSQLPTSMSKKQDCFTIPNGSFKINSSLYFSNGSDFCYFPSMTLFSKKTGKSNANGILNYKELPIIMNNKGNCE